MAEKERKRDIIFLLIDTVRASDAYGTMLSNIGYMSRSGSVYENAVAPGTWTAPTHAALFTNRRVSSIRNVSRDFFSNGTMKIDPWLVKTKFLPGKAQTIAARLSQLGYKSVLLSNNPFLSSYTNLAIGFNKIYDLWLETNVKGNKGLADKLSFIIKGGAKARVAMMDASYAITKLLPSSQLDKLYLYLRKKLDSGVAEADGTYCLDRGAAQTEKVLARYLDHIYDYSPQFIFVNYMEAHENYPVRSGIVQDKWLYLSGIEPMDQYALKKLHSAYARRIRYLDSRVGKLLSMLKGRGMLDHSTVVIASDHGQAFGEHGMLYHSLPPYESISKVPLIAVNYENGRMVKTKDRVSSPVSLLALHNALLDMAAGKEEYLNGNLRRDRYVFSEHKSISEGWDEQLLRMLKPRSEAARMIYKAKYSMNKPAAAIYKGSMKLVHFFGAKTDELYDLSKDSGESDNIIGANRELALSMLKAYSA
ncbi:MAG: sulfatase-like hydrolase/transferase [Candidatus Micrarchaeaceae archaeon]